MFSKLRRKKAQPDVPAIVPEAETRGRFEAELVSVSDAAGMMRLFDLDSGPLNEVVNVQTALGVPAIWAAVNFIAGTLAVLPKHIHELDSEGQKQRVPGHPLAAILNRAPDEETGAYDWFFNAMVGVLTAGRFVAFIERDQRGEVMNLWPLPIDKLRLRRADGKTRYIFQDGTKTYTYQPSEVIDLRFMPGADRLQSLSPVSTHRGTIALSIAVQKYGAKMFGNGGVPPFVVTGPFNSPGAMERATDDVTRAMQAANEEGRQSMGLPDGHDIKPVGVDPEKMQLVDVQRFIIEQIARIYNLPPVFLQDLTHGTFSNTEQQDGHVAKHTIHHWVSQWEAELNLKLFGRAPGSFSVEINMGGLLRGDFKTTMDGLARGVQTGLLTPNEGRALDNRPPMPGGNQLLIQGAMVPLQPTETPGDDPAATPEDLDNDSD